MIEQTTQTNAAFAKKMQTSAIWLLVLGIIGTMGVTGAPHPAQRPLPGVAGCTEIL